MSILADRLATPEDAASLLERDDIDAYKAGVLVEISTAIVQEAAGGQRIVQVVDDVAEIMGTTSSWLQLPQLPVTAVASVVIDGVTLTLGTDYKRFGSRLWSRTGWQLNWGQYTNYVSPGSLGGSGAVSYEYNYGHYADYGTLSQSEPSGLIVVNTHGFAAGAQELQLGRGAVLSMITGAYGNPQGLKAESTDDYAVTYAALAAQLLPNSPLYAAIRRKYGRRAGHARA